MTPYALLLNILTATSGAAAERVPGTWWGMPEQGSTIAPIVDWIYAFINWLCLFFFVLIVVVMVYFMFKYRRRSHVASTSGATHNTPLEVTWTAIPLILVIAIFYVGLKGYVHITTPPENAYEIQVTGARWNWTFSYPNGATVTDVLHVPVGRPVKLEMRSDDVIHAMFIPAFRVKQDVVPGKRTVLWFEATREGDFDLYCSEYCGTEHSQMVGRVLVHGDDEFEVIMEEEARWIDKVADKDLYKAGALSYNLCVACHTVDGSPKIGPSFKETHDLFKAGGPRRLKDGSSVTVDEEYIRDSILNPTDHIAWDEAKNRAYPSSMPPGIGNLLGPRKVESLVRMIMQLDEVAPDGKLVEVKREDIVVEDAEGE